MTRTGAWAQPGKVCRQRQVCGKLDGHPCGPRDGPRGVTLAMGIARAGALGQRLAGPPPIPAEALEQVGRDDWARHIAEHCGESPRDWDQWARRAEKGLLVALDVDYKDAMARRGGPLVYAAQTLTRVQEGESGVRANIEYRALRLHAARQERYRQVGASAGRGAAALHPKLRGDVEPDPQRRAALERCLQAARRGQRQGTQACQRNQKEMTTRSRRGCKQRHQLAEHRGKAAGNTLATPGPRWNQSMAAP